MNANKRAVIVAGKLVQDHEFIYPYYRLLEEGYDVDVAVRDKQTVFGSMGVRIEPTCDISGLQSQPYNLLVIPGGAKAMEYMRQDRELLQFIATFHECGKLIASICHGAQLLISAGLVRGRRISGYYSIKDDIHNAGGQYVDAPAVVDDRIVTSPHYKHLGPWMRATLTQCQERAGDRSARRA